MMFISNKGWQRHIHKTVGGQARWDQDAGFAGAPNRPTRKRPLRRGVGCPELPARAGRRALPHGE